MESQLSAAPLCLQIMSHINILSINKDFSLLTTEDEKAGIVSIQKYKLIKEPRSFRACLEQVNSEAFEAFRMAHKNMGAIQMMTERIPDYMREAVKLLLGDNDRVIERHLPTHLMEIQNIAEECTKLAEDVEGKYKT